MYPKATAAYLIVFANLLAGSPAAIAADGPPRARDTTEAKPPSANGGSDQAEAVDTEHLFGFTEGADVGEAGEQEVLFDSISRFGKRRAGPGQSGYGVGDTRLSYQYDFTDAFSITAGVFGDVRRIRNVVDLDDKAFATFDGVSLDLKYQFLKGSNESPFGLALEMRPRFARVLSIEGRGADIFTVETLLQADVQLVPDRVWFGTNLSFEPVVGRLRGSGEGERTSTLLWSGAVVARIAERTFLGPEVRHQRAYDGAYLNRLEGQAVFVGPALHHRFTEKAFLTLAYSAQVWGRDEEPGPGRASLDLRNFERHNLRLKLGLDF